MAETRRKRLSDADKRARDRLVLEARSTGATWAQIAERFSLSERATQRAASSAARLAAEQGLDDIDAGALLEAIVRAEARALYRLEELIYDPNPAVAVGACRAVGSVGSDLRASLVASGLIPGGDELFLRRESVAIAKAFMRAMDEVGIPEEALERALDAEPKLAGRWR